MELKRLQQELGSQTFSRLYMELREDHRALFPFPTVFDLIEFFRDHKSDYHTRDEILGLLIRLYQQGGKYEPLSALFLVLFTPGIVRTHMLARKKALNLEPKEVLNQTCLFLLETMNKEEIAPGSQKVAARVMGRVKNRMRDWVRERLKEEKMMEEFSEGSQYPPLPIIDNPSPPDLEEAERFLDIFKREGVITETDKWIILGTKIMGRPLREIAGAHESYQKVKKRRQRALREMERCLERKRVRYAMREGVERSEIALADVLKKLLG